MAVIFHPFLFSFINQIKKLLTCINMMSQNQIIVIILIILSSVEVLTFYCLQEYHVKNNFIYFFVAILLYIIIAYLLSYLFGIEKMAIVNSMWNAISIILIAIMGYVIFKQSLSFNEIIAMVLVIIAIILLLIK